MFPSYSSYFTSQPYSSWSTSSNIPRPSPGRSAAELTLPSQSLSMASIDPKTLSNNELITLLNKYNRKLKEYDVQDYYQKTSILIETLSILIRVQRPKLLNLFENEFFSSLRNPFIDILQQWSSSSILNELQIRFFHHCTKLIKRFIRTIDDITQLPLWLSDQTVLQTIGECLQTIGTSNNLPEREQKYPFKYFTRLFDAYIIFQQELDTSSHDKLLSLFDPLIECLTSQHYIQLFTDMQPDQPTMSTVEKFFLIKCPTLLVSYTGSQDEYFMQKLLSTMLPDYIQVLQKHVPFVQQWRKPMMRCVMHLMEMINHGLYEHASLLNLIAGHLPLIDQMMKLVETPMLQKNICANASNLETDLMHIVISFLVNMINSPSVLAYVKQARIAEKLLPLTSSLYEPLVLNVYSLLAFTMHEEDIEAMPNIGRLLYVIVDSLKKTLIRSPDNKASIEKLFETLKGLVQHNQLKDEVMKQNVLPFLIECTNILDEKTRKKVFETLWSLTFREEAALALRSNEEFLEKIQRISKENKDEGLKKATDGLVWKLIREPACLEKMAQQEADDDSDTTPVMETVTEVIVNEYGQKQMISTTRPIAKNATTEREFQYDMMISYCHADKELVYKIHKFLVDQGFKIWIDLDNMYGPAMNAMADAVENSEFVIMCMSDSYKQSTYCQAEAEYAFNCKRRLLPLIVRTGYRPDGWLGFMIGSRIYVDFGRYDFETACEKLMTEINLQRQRPPPTKANQMTTHEKPCEPPTKPSSITISQREKPVLTLDNKVLAVYMRRKASNNFTKKHLEKWTEGDVLDFLSTERLVPLMPLCETMDGGAFLQLYKMCSADSNRAYILLNNEMKTIYKMNLPIGIYTRFLSVMEKRIHSTPKMSPVQIVNVPPLPKIKSMPKVVPKIPEIIVNQHRSPPPLFQLPVTHQPYDILITSDASALEVLRAVERHGPKIQQLTLSPNRTPIYL